MSNLYADILLPLALPPMTYEVPEELCDAIAVGQGVQVQLGLKKVYMGIIWRLHHCRPPYKTIRSVGRPIRPEVLVGDLQRELWAWIADYYMAPLGDVMRAALPTSLKPSAMSQQEFDQSTYHLPTERCLKLSDAILSEQRLNELIESIPRRAGKQYDAVVEFCSRFDDFAAMKHGEVRLKKFDFSFAVVAALVKRGVFRIFEREISLGSDYDSYYNLSPLSQAQKRAFDEIKQLFEEKNTVLLHGVTGSGKTEIYSHLIAETLSAGGSVLYMLPEIAITKQLIERLQSFFGERVTVYHSKLTIAQRTKTYLRLCHSSGGELVVGVRSSLFLPVENLRLIIVDEEHDRSFKQEDPSPRYSARDSAVWLAQKQGIKCLLGSATPSVESYSNALSGRYGLVNLNERYGEGRMPRIIISDTIRNVKRGERRSHFNKELIDRIGRCLSEHRQVILFQNRRGFAPYMECTDCGWVAQCPSCSVTLTLHKAEGKLRCHYCGYSMPVPRLCPSCKVAEPVPQGFGTEKVEDEIALLFPEARVARLDSDTATSPTAYRRIIDDFEQQRTDILVGTQMITKGFDFAGVALVGVLNADNLLRIPNFRASERAFQTLMQVAGRAGRSDDEGEVVIQTAEPANPTLLQVLRNDYQAMVESQLSERRSFGYPPFGRLIEINMKHGDFDTLFQGADRLAAELRMLLGRNVIGPHAPAVERIGGEYILSVLVKIPAGSSAATTKSIIREKTKILTSHKIFRQIKLACNVDPQ